MKTKDIAQKYGIDQYEFEEFLRATEKTYDVGFWNITVADENVDAYVEEFKLWPIKQKEEQEKKEAERKQREEEQRLKEEEKKLKEEEEKLKEEEEKRREAMEKGLVFHFEGGLKDNLDVYEDRVVISHTGVLNVLAMGGFQGEKTIHYGNISSVQFKKADFWTDGYIQFSLPGGNEKHGGVMKASSDENSITIREKDRQYSKSKEAEEIVNFINKKIAAARNGTTQTVTQAISPADEIKKYKDLLDIGAITQEEYDAKKKQLLGL